jgi:hypothetical protein
MFLAGKAAWARIVFILLAMRALGPASFEAITTRNEGSLLRAKPPLVFNRSGARRLECLFVLHEPS